MAEKTIDGYIIKITDYNVFDAIVSILTITDTITACFAQGVKKILSKNARHLIIGNYNESSIFFASENKLSKLKKTVCIDTLDLTYHNWTAFQILTNFAVKLSGYVPGFFALYNRLIQLMKTNKYSDAYLSLFIVVELMKYLGIKFTHHCCVRCEGKNDILTIDFIHGGFICKECYLTNHQNMYLFNINDLKELHFLFHSDQPREVNLYQKKSLALLLKGLLTIIDRYSGIDITKTIKIKN